MWTVIITNTVTVLVAVFGSAGLWNYRMKKLELSQTKDDKMKTLTDKIDKVLDNQDKQSQQLKDLQDQLTKTDAVTMALAKDRIYYLCKRGISKLDVNPDTMRDIMALMKPYKANDGDGLADEYFEKYEYIYRTYGGEAE